MITQINFRLSKERKQALEGGWSDSEEPSHAYH
jgi:hypothetical protein